MRKVFYNKYDEVRSGWDMLWVTAVSYLVMMAAMTLIIFVVTMITLLAGGEEAVNAIASQGSRDAVLFNLISQSVSELILLGVLYLIWRYYHKKSLTQIGLQVKNAGKQIGMGLLLGMISITAVYITLLATGQIKLISVSWSNTTGMEIFLSVILFTVVGFAEEILCRGYWMSVLQRTRNQYAPVIISGLCFSLIHIMNDNFGFMGFLNIFLVGVLFALLFIKSGALWIPIGFHITWNFFQGNIFGLNVSGMETSGFFINEIVGGTLMTGGAFGAEGSIVVTVIIVLEVLLVCFFMNRPLALSDER